jgi:hypothetical protein
MGAQAIIDDIPCRILQQIEDLPTFRGQFFHGLTKTLLPVSRGVIVARKRQDLML